VLAVAEETFGKLKVTDEFSGLATPLKFSFTALDDNAFFSFGSLFSHMVSLGSQ
jgi:hypothetical protein